MANTISGTINVKIQVQGGGITASTAGGGMGTAAQNKKQEIEDNKKANEEQKLYFKTIEQAQKNNEKSFKIGKQEEQEYNKQVAEAFKLYNKDMLEDLKKGYEQIKEQMLLDPMKYTAEEGEKVLKGADLIKFSASQAKGIENIQDQGKLSGIPAFKAMSKFLPALGLVGGVLGIAGILQQSKIFTGILGAINDMLGALVDIILAPLVPLLVPVLKLLAITIQQMALFFQDPAGYLEKIWTDFIEWLKQAFLHMIPGEQPGENKLLTKTKVPLPELTTKQQREEIKKLTENAIIATTSLTIAAIIARSAPGLWKAGALIPLGIGIKSGATTSDALRALGEGATQEPGLYSEKPFRYEDYPGLFGQPKTNTTTIGTINIQIPGLIGEGVLTPYEIGQRVGKGLLDEIDQRTP